MTTVIDKTYRKDKLLDWEVKSLTDKYSFFSFSKKSTWLTLGLIIGGLCVLAFIFPFVPPRFNHNWAPPTTSDQYLGRLTYFLIAAPLIIISLFACINLRTKLDILLGVKWTANFAVTGILNLGTIKILILNGWRLFIIKTRQGHFDSVTRGQVISLKRTGTLRRISYYIRDNKIDEKASH